MPCHQDPGHNGQHAFATFIHSAGSAALSRAAAKFAFYSLYSLAPDSPPRQYLKRHTPALFGVSVRGNARTRVCGRWSLNQLVMLKAQLKWNGRAGDQPGLRASRPRGAVADGSPELMPAGGLPRAAAVAMVAW
jgi:hypothetical protein